MTTKKIVNKKSPAAKKLQASLNHESPAVTSTAFELPAGYVVKRKITLPTLVMNEVGKQYVVRIDDAIRKSTVDTKKVDKDGNPEKPADVCHCTDVETGEESTLLVPAVMHGNLLEGYPDDSYVGLTFVVKNLGKAPGKRYVRYSIAEVGGE